MPLLRIPNPESRIPRGGSSKPAGNVILGPLLRRIREDRILRARLDQVAQVPEAGEVCNARTLPQVVGSVRDGVVSIHLSAHTFPAAGDYSLPARCTFSDQ